MCLECLIEMDLKTNIVVKVLNSDTGKGIEFYFDDPPPDNKDFTRKLSGSDKWNDLELTCKGINLTPSQTVTGIRVLFG